MLCKTQQNIAPLHFESICRACNRTTAGFVYVEKKHLYQNSQQIKIYSFAYEKYSLFSTEVIQEKMIRIHKSHCRVYLAHSIFGVGGRLESTRRRVNTKKIIAQQNAKRKRREKFYNLLFEKENHVFEH